jgi:D-isomer specific 2-hydroxyacid dehydrogenase, catalytic domain
VFQAARDLRTVALFGVGYDMIDVCAATRHRVAIAMASGANHEAVADSGPRSMKPPWLPSARRGVRWRPATAASKACCAR